MAVEVPGQLEDEVAGIARQLGAAVSGRFMPRGNYHVTLAFLGDIDEAAASAAIAALDEACAGIPPVELRASELGTFGRGREVTLWLGFAAASGLADLAERVRGHLAARSLPFDEKPFRPHITLARRARIPRSELPQLAFPQPVRAARVTLFRSFLASDGATYKPLYTVELGEE